MKLVQKPIEIQPERGKIPEYYPIRMVMTLFEGHDLILSAVSRNYSVNLSGNYRARLCFERSGRGSVDMTSVWI